MPVHLIDRKSDVLCFTTFYSILSVYSLTFVVLHRLLVLLSVEFR